MAGNPSVLQPGFEHIVMTRGRPYNQGLRKPSGPCLPKACTVAIKQRNAGRNESRPCLIDINYHNEARALADSAQIQRARPVPEREHAVDGRDARSVRVTVLHGPAAYVQSNNVTQASLCQIDFYDKVRAGADVVITVTADSCGTSVPRFISTGGLATTR
ncbi:hypothetical protein EDB83DRAFT_2557980 [Lactarius deliciosus]|nr:hypothetical protein EDB83DRAFT_2557980 [Lactarius deliciosus]